MHYSSLKQLPAIPVSHNAQIKKKLLLSFGQIPHLTNFSQATFPPGEIAPAHAHKDMYEVFFIESGEGTIEIDGIIYPTNPGDCFLISPNELHEIRNTGILPLIVTYFGIQQ